VSVQVFDSEQAVTEAAQATAAQEGVSNNVPASAKPVVRKIKVKPANLRAGAQVQEAIIALCSLPALDAMKYVAATLSAGLVGVDEPDPEQTDSPFNLMRGVCTNLEADPALLGALKMLVEDYGADVNQRFVTGATPLQCCARSAACTAGLQFLLDQGVEPDDADDAGLTPLLAACQFGEAAVGASGGILELLLSKGADAGRRTRDGRSAAHLCAASGNVPAMRLLLERGAVSDGDMNEPDPAAGSRNASPATWLRLVLGRSPHDDL
jgi:hypothetical protein